ncbi:hypothetical protein SAMN05660690_1554 [Geodermatophilus telluris]|uniref:Uncharacterized protein n=1 Tax=Geodermatophilus telluris TaxID=1190417 RepID=A0A1G6LU71_9ACTN|nr:hypothetical protein [Geodermatophilus telluris]SDC46770.1 hypothetical protein SAMN05660690_1554 [Geodermatophilus telluris]
MTEALLQLLAITGMLVGSFAAMGVAFRLFSGQLQMDLRARRTVRRRARGLDPPPEPVHRPVEQVAADLRRLAAQLDRVPAGSPAVRRRGFQAAYDDVLTEAAGQLAVPHGLATLPPGPARDVERLRLETALAGAGLVLR